MDPSADITRFRTRNLNWIERSRLFCYSVINFLYWTSFSSFAFELQKLLYFITISFFVKHFFLFVFNQDSKENVFFKTHFFASLIDVKKSIYGRLFFSKPLLSQATLILYHILDKCQEKFAIIKLIIANQRRRRDLNPCAAINDLLTFQASPFGLLGTSPN